MTENKHQNNLATAEDWEHLEKTGELLCSCIVCGKQEMILLKDLMGFKTEQGPFFYFCEKCYIETSEHDKNLHAEAAIRREC